jgi:hypothetical protein
MMTMPERAPYEQLAGQLDMWNDFATPAANSLRAETSRLSSTRTACFDEAGVVECLAAGIA